MGEYRLLYAREKGEVYMNDGFAVVVLFYLVPLLPLALTWRKDMSKTVTCVVLWESVGSLAFVVVFALVGLYGWQWHLWGQVSIGEIVAFWQGESLPASLWIWPGIWETALLLLARWVAQAVRQATGPEQCL